MIVKVFSAALKGIDAYIVDVETDINLGMPKMELVGLPDAAVQESRERVRAAIKHSGLEFPLKKIVVNLAPADTKKEGPSFDLPIAIAVLAASYQINREKLNKYLLLGELSLDGTVRPVNGVLCYAIAAKEKGIEAIIVPFENAQEASVVNGLKVYPVKTLTEAVQIINEEDKIEPIIKSEEIFESENVDYSMDFGDVKAQEFFYTKVMCNT